MKYFKAIVWRVRLLALRCLNYCLSWVYKYPRFRNGQKTVFFVGHDRSGSSWISGMLGKADNTLYVYEPINVDASYLGDFSLYNTYLLPGQRSNRHEAIFDIASSGFGTQIVPFYKIGLKLFSNPTIVVKEVGGMLLGEWFQDRYGGTVVLLTRHPAPVIFSNIKMARSNADDWLKSMRADLDVYGEFLSRYDLESLDEADTVTKFAVIYCIRYSIALSQLQRNSGWVQVKYEDFCVNPELEFERLFDVLGLDFSESIRANIQETSKIDGSEHFFGTSRKSQEMLYKWQKDCSVDDEIKMRKVLQVFKFPLYTLDRDWERRPKQQEKSELE